MTQNDFWDRLKQRLVEVSTAAADFTEEQAMIGKLKFEMLTVSRRIEHLQRDIGVRVTELSKLDDPPSPFSDSEIKGALIEIAQQEEVIKRKKAEIERVSNFFRAKAASRQEDNARTPTGSAKPPYDQSSPPAPDYVAES